MRRGPSSRLLARFVATAAAAMMIAGCTFLIGFDEVPGATDASVDGPTMINAPDVRVDAPAPVDAPSGDAGADARDAVANPDACANFADGKYCGGNQIPWPVANKDDLVTCQNRMVANVRFCADLGGCIRMLNGYPDQCDECAKKPDGLYCGRDMGGWEPKNFNSLVHCQNKASVGTTPCGAQVCTSNGAASSCN